MPAPYRSESAVATAWRRPSVTDAKVVDAVEAAWCRPGVAVVLRGTLSCPTTVSSGAWADFLAAVKRGEYDQLPSGERRRAQATSDHAQGTPRD